MRRPVPLSCTTSSLEEEKKKTGNLSLHNSDKIHLPALYLSLYHVSLMLNKTNKIYILQGSMQPPVKLVFTLKQTRYIKIIYQALEVLVGGFCYL